MFSVKNKTIIVTGASGVIGSAVSAALAKNGARMILLGRSEKKLQETFHRISQTGMETTCNLFAMFWISDSLERVREKLLKEVHKIDALDQYCRRRHTGSVNQNRISE
jgi:NADP-dependent 3-hydroxy acid dehydrogenase YdfG